LKTKAHILRESTAQSVEALIPQIHLFFHQYRELLTLAMPQMAHKDAETTAYFINSSYLGGGSKPTILD